MTTAEILDQLRISYTSFTDYIDSLSEEQFLNAANGSWSAGQQLEHIVKSVVPLNTYMKLPNFMKIIMFGTNKGSSRTYDYIVATYQTELGKGGKAPNNFEPEVVLFSLKKDLISKLHYNLNKFLTSIKNTSEKDLDKFRIPHPLIGKISIREMLYFSDYHVKHHQKSIQNILNK